MCDAFLALPEDERELFILGRRLGRLSALEHLDRPGARRELAEARDRLRAEGRDPTEFAADLRRRMV